MQDDLKLTIRHLMETQRAVKFETADFENIWRTFARRYEADRAMSSASCSPTIAKLSASVSSSTPTFAGSATSGGSPSLGGSLGGARVGGLGRFSLSGASGVGALARVLRSGDGAIVRGSALRAAEFELDDDDSTEFVRYSSC